VGAADERVRLALRTEHAVGGDAVRIDNPAVRGVYHRVGDVAGAPRVEMFVRLALTEFAT